MKHLFTALLGLSLLSAPALANEPTAALDLANGEAKFNRWCAACHNPGAKHHPGTGALTKLYEGTDISPVLAERDDLSYDMLHFFVRNGTSIMPFFRKTELSDSDVADIAGFLMRNYSAE